MATAKEFAARLAQERREKSARERRDISRTEVGEAVELTGAAISRYEKGRLIPDDDILERLAEFFGVRRIWLREGEGERYTRAVPVCPKCERGLPVREVALVRPATSREAGGGGKR